MAKKKVKKLDKEDRMDMKKGKYSAKEEKKENKSAIRTGSVKASMKAKKKK